MADIRFPRKEPPCRVFWCWDISYRCDYKCSYCRVDTWRETRYADVAKWTRIWDEIFANYGTTHIRFSGGEPFLYPGFIELMRVLGERHTLNVTTNLHIDERKLVRECGPIADKSCLVISSSYHPEYCRLDEFIAKVLYLKSHGIYTSVSMVAWPPFLQDIPRVKGEMEKNDIQFQVIPLGGHFFEKDYPGGYTDEERAALARLAVTVSNKASKTMFDFKVGQEDRKTPRRLCRMGMNFGMIRPNGDVFRCCTFEKCAYLGNILDGTFKLIEEPQWCELEPCNCYKAMLVGEDAKCATNWNWARHKEGLYHVPKAA
jgi:MoaA/NifB/PqqE/SkfB family radical SAM enzyme